MTMLLSDCTFETDRLLVREWHSPQDGACRPPELAPTLAAMLTESVTRSLPPSWQGSYTFERARAWIRERDEEGATLLVVDRSTRRPIGLMILFEIEAAEGSGEVDVRLGYLLSEAAWGKGFASELVAGFVTWCRESSVVSSLTGGVAPDNPASRRVLEKNGFQPVLREDEAAQEEQLYRLRFR